MKTTPYPCLVFYEATETEVISHAVGQSALRPRSKRSAMPPARADGSEPGASRIRQHLHYCRTDIRERNVAAGDCQGCGIHDEVGEPEAHGLSFAENALEIGSIV
jgi:hypothetical protein